MSNSSKLKERVQREVLELMYPKEIPDYQKLKASRYYEEHRETLQKLIQVSRYLPG